ncbi:FAD-dependent oxidoreductase, partial [Leeia sp. TBRC 13508]
MSKNRYSLWSLFKQGLKHNKGWEPAWTSPQLKPSYDVIIIGGGGHGLATAYYLAKNHGVKNIAVLE